MSKMTPNQLTDLAKMRVLTLAVLALVFVVLILLGSVLNCQGQEIASEYVYAVVARNPGLAGTDWHTELCITNPQWYELQINVRLVQDGAWVGTAATINHNSTLCSDDFIFDWFGFEEYQGSLILRAVSEDNPNLAYLQFTPSVRIYNRTLNGTMGVNVTPYPVFEPDDPRGDLWAWGQASGIVQWGERGESGFRASIGFFNSDDDQRDVQFWLRAANGNVLWNETLELEPMSQEQIPIPGWIEVDHGSITAQADDWRGPGLPPIYGYATVTDNQTGDGVFKPMLSPYTFQVEEDK